MNANPSPALSVIATLGLIEVTSDKQLRNGTRMFYDPTARVYYGSYAAGYARRLYLSPFYGNKREMMMYPLNPREMKSVYVYRHEFDNTDFTGFYSRKGYKLINDPVKRLEIIASAATLYRTRSWVKSEASI